MKLTWFGATAFRLHIGGEIIVVDPDLAPDVDPRELRGGADRIMELAAADVPLVDLTAWRPRPAPRGIDALSPLEIFAPSPGSLLLDAPGEPPLLLIGAGDPPALGRGIDGAVVVCPNPSHALALLAATRPRLVVLVGAADDDIAVLAPNLDGAGLSLLEPGLALEV